MSYYVYMMTNERGNVLYTGVTNDLARRVYEHKNQLASGFTARYNVCKLVFFEEFREVKDAISAEKRIKGWNRQRKNELIERANPQWTDLS